MVTAVAKSCTTRTTLFNIKQTQLKKNYICKMANNMAVMVRGLRQFIVDEKTRISRENQTLGATEKKPVPESLLDLIITDIVTQEDIRVGDFLATERDGYGDTSERIIFIVQSRGKYYITGTTIKRMMSSPKTNIYFNCTGREKQWDKYDRQSKALKIALNHTIYVPYKQIEKLILSVKRKDQRIFFAVASGVQYSRTVSQGIIDGDMHMSGYHCQNGTSIDLYDIELCSDDVCSITRRLAEPARTRKRTRAEIEKDMEGQVGVIHMLLEEKDEILENLMNPASKREKKELKERLQMNDQQLKTLEEQIKDADRRIRRKVDKERAMLETVHRYEKHTNFINEFRARMVVDATALAEFLADGPHDAVDVTILRKLMASMEEFLIS